MSEEVLGSGAGSPSPTRYVSRETLPGSSRIRRPSRVICEVGAELAVAKRRWRPDTRPGPVLRPTGAEGPSPETLKRRSTSWPGLQHRRHPGPTLGLRRRARQTGPQVRVQTPAKPGEARGWCRPGPWGQFCTWAGLPTRCHSGAGPVVRTRTALTAGQPCSCRIPVQTRRRAARHRGGGWRGRRPRERHCGFFGLYLDGRRIGLRRDDAVTPGRFRSRGRPRPSDGTRPVRFPRSPRRSRSRRYRTGEDAARCCVGCPRPQCTGGRGCQLREGRRNGRVTSAPD